MSLGYFIDIQGTILSDLDKSPIQGAVEFIAKLQKTKTPFVLVTNNTKQKSDDLIAFLQKNGFEIGLDNFIDPLMILDNFVKNQSVKTFGSEEFCEVLLQLGFNVVSDNADAILIASGYKFTSNDYADMIESVIDGSKLIGMHATSIYAKNKRRFPGVGAIIAMIEYSTGVKAKIIGKPSEEYYKNALLLLQKQDPNLTFKDVCIISDDAIGDLVGAKKLNMKTNLVLSGKCKNRLEIAHISDKIDAVFNDISEIL